MRRFSLTKILLVTALLALMLAACAPEDLDITPSPTATLTPTPRPTDIPTPTPDPNASEEEVAQAAADAQDAADEADAEAAAIAADSPQGQLDVIIAAVPNAINAGQVTWSRNGDVTPLQGVDGGVAARLPFNERGGSIAELTIGIFDTPELAMAYWQATRDRLRTLERAEIRDNFPLPNAFGGGTYGSDAIFVIGNVFLRVSVPQFSSTLGDPLGPLSRQALNILEEQGIVAEEG